MKKSSLGIIIFGFIFIVISAYCFWAGHILYAVYPNSRVAPSIHRAVTSRLKVMENFFSEKVPASKQALAYKQRQVVRNATEHYKKNYVIDKKIPIPLAASAAFSLLTGAIFLYTGIIMLRLHPNTRTWISISFLAGFLCYCAFLWSSLITAVFPFQASKPLNALLELASGKTNKISYSIFAITESPAIRIIMIIMLTGYLTLMASTSLFFPRKKIKEKFLNGKNHH